jgi:RNA polymerase sigma-70 factor (family 1)
VTAEPLERLGSAREVAPRKYSATARADGRFAAALRGDEQKRALATRRLGVSSDDRMLLAQMSAGEAHAFAALFSRYYDALCAFANGYTASRSEAEEVVEDVFVRLWELREHLEVRASLKSYLYTATRNRALNRLRDQRAEGRRLEEARFDSAPPGMGQPKPSLEEEMQATEFARAVARAVEQLPPRTRQVFLLHRQHGLTYAEIATALEISPKTVENLLGRALKHLRAHLAPFLGE